MGLDDFVYRLRQISKCTVSSLCWFLESLLLLLLTADQSSKNSNLFIFIIIIFSSSYIFFVCYGTIYVTNTKYHTVTKVLKPTNILGIHLDEDQDMSILQEQYYKTDNV